MSPHIYTAAGSGFCLWTTFLSSPLEEKSPPRMWLEAVHGAGHCFGSPHPPTDGSAAGTP